VTSRRLPTGKTSEETQELLAEAESALSHSVEQPVASEPKKKAAKLAPKKQVSSKTAEQTKFAEQETTKAVSK